MLNDNDLIRRGDLKDLLLKRSFFPAIVAAALKEISKVDAVEVVRCKDCKHGKLDDTIYFKTVDGETNDTTQYRCYYRWDKSELNNANHYCGYGERKYNAID